MELTPAPRAVPRVADYTDYRVYLRDFFMAKKSHRAGFSYRRFAALCGLKSPNYLQLVIQGERNLTPETGERVAKAIKMSAAETRYFVALLRQESAENEEKRRWAEKELYRAVKGLKTNMIQKADHAIFEDWTHLAVRELALLKDFEPTGAYVSSRLSGLISADQAEKSLRFLIDHGWLVEEDGRLVPKDPVLDSGNDLFAHQLMQSFHAKVLAMWSKNIAELDSAQQELGLLNIPIPRDKIPELRQKLRQFQDEIVGWTQSFTEADCLVQLGTYLMRFETKENE